MKSLRSNRFLTTTVAASLAVVLAAIPMTSEAQRWHGGGGRGWGGGGWGWGPAFGLALGVDLALAASPRYVYAPDPWYPQTVYVTPPTVVYQQPAIVTAAPAPAPANTSPEPIVYPRNGQSAEQTESDMRACNSWATSQPRALADSSVFHRAVGACMDGRGYSLR